MEGNPLFEFQFSPINSQQWLRRVQKTVFHAQLRQLRDPLDTDDMGVTLVSALEEATKQHLEKIGARVVSPTFTLCDSISFGSLSIHLWHRGNIVRQSNQEQTRRRRRWEKPSKEDSRKAWKKERSSGLIFERRVRTRRLTRPQCKRITCLCKCSN